VPKVQPCILVVDDEPAIRNFLRVSLEQQGMTVLEAGNALEALQRIRRDNPDLMLLDLGLPDRDGLRLLEDVRLESNMPIIVVTARAEEEAQLRGLELGADDYVTKPFSLAQLEARIQAILRRGKRRRRPTRRSDESPPPN
jgi:two-component system KDP operon response regulator KdpE